MQAASIILSFVSPGPVGEEHVAAAGVIAVDRIAHTGARGVCSATCGSSGPSGLSAETGMPQAWLPYCRYLTRHVNVEDAEHEDDGGGDDEEEEEEDVEEEEEEEEEEGIDGGVVLITSAG